jgi:hypothetical protein
MLEGFAAKWPLSDAGFVLVFLGFPDHGLAWRNWLDALGFAG